MTSLLERHDDAAHRERPPNFDWAKESADFAGFLAGLESRAGRRFKFETGSQIQDASFHSEISLPGGYLRFSNFGRMIAFGPDSDVEDEILGAVRTLAMERGYTLVETAELERPYPRPHATPLGISTWWIRYFDYV